MGAAIELRLFFCPTRASSCHQISISVPSRRLSRIREASSGNFF